ncbi:alpha/beta hydrolase, partial [Mesorhizobium sp. M7A.F.Ca.US.001.01.1.1]
LYWADGLGHRRILADKGVVERAVGFVTHREPLLLH